MSRTESLGWARAFVLLLGVSSSIGAMGCDKTVISPHATGGQRVSDSGGNAGGSMVGAGGAPGEGGANSAGGAQGTDASTGGSSGTVVRPRVPKNHRAQATSCVGVNAPPESGSERGCKGHADCTEGVNGRCVSTPGSGYGITYCVYDLCATDDDCDPGRVCHCAVETSARCLSIGNCQTDADCGGGSYGCCSPSNGPDCLTYHSIDSYYCHTPEDLCIDDSDCAIPKYCNYDAVDGRWECVAPNYMCAIG